MRILRPFFANFISIFHKTEVQTVILRCLTNLNLNWYNSYDTKRKNTKNANVCFHTKSQKNGNGNICVSCHNFWTNQNLDQLSTSKWPSEPQFCERWTYIWQKKWPEMVVKRSFMRNIHFKSAFIIAQWNIHFFDIIKTQWESQ